MMFYDFGWYPFHRRVRQTFRRSCFLLNVGSVAERRVPSRAPFFCLLFFSCRMSPSTLTPTFMSPTPGTIEYAVSHPRYDR